VSRAETSVLLRPFLEEDAIQRAEAQIRAELASRMQDLGSDPGQLMRLFQRIHLPGLLLRLDSATMAHGVEGRVPFLDPRLIALLNSLPWLWKMKPGEGFWSGLDDGRPAETLSEIANEPKALLKRFALTCLPESIVHRRKLGFPIPEAYFLDGARPEGIVSYYGAWTHINLRLWAGGGNKPWKS
jgi:asparagine synthase (glutamine-hydrolysing)